MLHYFPPHHCFARWGKWHPLFFCARGETKREWLHLAQLQIWETIKQRESSKKACLLYVLFLEGVQKVLGSTHVVTHVK